LFGQTSAEKNKSRREQTTYTTFIDKRDSGNKRRKKQKSVGPVLSFIVRNRRWGESKKGLKPLDESGKIICPRRTGDGNQLTLFWVEMRGAA